MGDRFLMALETPSIAAGLIHISANIQNKHARDDFDRNLAVVFVKIIETLAVYSRSGFCNASSALKN